jgi:hypothetical protein
MGLPLFPKQWNGMTEGFDHQENGKPGTEGLVYRLNLWHFNIIFNRQYNIWLVVWNMTFIFPYGNVIIPTDALHHFSEG